MLNKLLGVSYDFKDLVKCVQQIQEKRQFACTNVNTCNEALKIGCVFERAGEMVCMA